MKRGLAWAVASALAASALGCGLDPLPPLEACDDARRLGSGACCPPWTRAEGDSVCAQRGFTLPAASDALGEPGANAIDLVVDPSGRGVAAWSIAQSAMQRGAIAEERADGGWALRAPTAGLPGVASQLEVAAEPDGSALVAWRQYHDNGGNILVSRRDTAGAWTDPSDLSERFSFAPNAFEPRLAVHPSGEVLFVWNQSMSTGYGVSLARRAPGSQAWELPASPEDVLSPKIAFSNSPQVVIGASGGAIVTWFQSTGGPLMVRASERLGPLDELSRPSADEIISAPGAPVDSHPIANPTPAIGPSGEAVIAWTQENGEGALPVYIATRDPSGAWTKPRDLADSFSRPSGTARCVQVAFDAKGELYVTWYQDEGSGNRAYAARRAPSGAWIDSGTSPVLLSTESWQGLTPVLAVGADGAVLVVWPESLGETWRIGARRTSSGEPWGSSEILSPETPGVVTGLAAAAGGPSARMLVGWTQGPYLAEHTFFASAD